MKSRFPSIVAGGYIYKVINACPGLKITTYKDGLLFANIIWCKLRFRTDKIFSKSWVHWVPSIMISNKQDIKMVA